MAAHPIVDVVLNLSLYSLIAGGIFVGIEGWNLVDSIYFTIITGTTVGYGDISPQTPVGRWFAVFFLPFAVIFVSTQLSSLANILLGKNEDGKLKVPPLGPPQPPLREVRVGCRAQGGRAAFRPSP